MQDRCHRPLGGRGAANQLLGYGRTRERAAALSAGAAWAPRALLTSAPSVCGAGWSHSLTLCHTARPRLERLIHTFTDSGERDIYDFLDTHDIIHMVYYMGLFCPIADLQNQYLISFQLDRR